MKRVTLILVVLLTATCPLGAGEWRIGGHIGTGFSGGHHRGGTSIGFSNFGLGHHRVAYPGGGFVLHIGGDDFSFTWTGGGLRSRYHRYPRYRRYRRYRRYYRTPYYVLGPWCWYGGYGGAVVTGTWGGRSVFEDPPVVRGGGDVFLVPVSGTPAADAGELEGIDAPIPQPATPEERKPAAPERTDTPRDDELTNLRRLIEKNDLDEAEDVLRRKVRRDPSDAQMSYLYAYVLFRCEKFSSAAFLLRRAIVLDPERLETLPALIGDLASRGEKGDDMTAVDKHIADHPDDAPARLVRAFVRFLNGSRDTAREDLDAILKTSKSDPQAARLLEVCRESETPGE